MSQTHTQQKSKQAWKEDEWLGVAQTTNKTLLKKNAALIPSFAPQCDKT